MDGWRLMTDRLAMVADLWTAHRQAPFPRRLTSVDVMGVDMVVLDLHVAMCVNSWLNRDANDDDQCRDMLATCAPRLRRVIPELPHDEAAYYQRLLDMTTLVLEALGDPPSG
ncbi:hypothetical protein J5X84_41935 [Streptosporangiaceae bacterium NEAU-GS5]|nr:hypothetical protein [Streptosporangiaceae bacterium NEAU-GS5]